MLGRKSLAVAGESVRVFRGGVVLCDAWQVFFSTTRIEVLTEGEVSIVSDRHDWIGDPNELLLDGNRTDLQQGDTCEWVNDGYTFVFEAQPADGENVSSPHGPHKKRIRSHWKLIDWRSNE